MASLSLEKRLAILEAEVGKLRQEVRAAGAAKAKDWRRTIGAFTGDDGMQQILRDAMHLREANRKKTRNAKGARRKKS